jgi:alkylation response protein AidB-like acyl-CoA dehydrogenase
VTGDRLGNFQALRHQLADHATELESTRLLVHDGVRIRRHAAHLFAVLGT